MNNYGFEIGLNGKILTRAGFDNQYFVLSCIADSLRRKIDESEELHFSVGGLNVETEQHVNWLSENLKLDDVISIQIINNKFDKPTTVREQETKEMEIKRKIEYFYRLKDELKEYLNK